MGIFDFLKKGQNVTPDQASEKPEKQEQPGKAEKPDNADLDHYTDLANKLYPGIQMFARDLNLDPALAAKYVPEMIIREKGITDTTSRFMGMVTTHRYVILSNHMANLSTFEHGTNWGLHIAQMNSHFKVLGTATHEGKTGIFLLHLPDDETWKEFDKIKFSMDDQLFDMAVQRFKAKCTGPAVPELTTEEWLDRCAWPIGMTADGKWFMLEDSPKYTLEYIKELAERPDNSYSSELYARHDVSLGKWRLIIQLGNTRKWFLSVFIRDDGTFDTYCLDDESASDSHYEFTDEEAIRGKVYQDGDESLLLGDILKRCAAKYGADALYYIIKPYVTAEFHYD